MKTRPERDPQQKVYSIPCECGRSYIGETGRTLAVRLHEHTCRHNFKAGLLEKSKLAQHAYEEAQFLIPSYSVYKIDSYSVLHYSS
jgi:hypothetical protein